MYILKVYANKARLAQSVEHGTLNPRVVGSSPTLGAITFFSGLCRFCVPSTHTHRRTSLFVSSRSARVHGPNEARSAKTSRVTFGVVARVNFLMPDGV